MDPYILHRFKVQPNCHIDKELIFEKQVQVFSAKMEDDEGKAYMFTLLPQEFSKIHRHDNYLYSHYIGFEVFLMGEMNGVDT